MKRRIRVGLLGKNTLLAGTGKVFGSSGGNRVINIAPSEPDHPDLLGPRVKVIGVGGSGGHIVQAMRDRCIENVEYLFVDTDRDALERLVLPYSRQKIEIGARTTRGRGAEANPEIGKHAAIESRELLQKALRGAHFIILTAGLGGGTGSGAMPVIADICSTLGATVVGVVCMPFSFEGERRRHYAIDALSEVIIKSATVVVENDSLVDLSRKPMKVDAAFSLGNEILGDIIGELCAYTTPETQPTQIDLTEAKSVFGTGGIVRYGFGTSMIGELPLGLAGKRAAESPLLPQNTLRQTNTAIVTIRGNLDLTFDEIRSSVKVLQERMDRDVHLFCGITVGEAITDSVRVSLFATEHTRSRPEYL